MPPKVSICVPTYKQTEYLKKTLDSIVFQTFTDYEIIITDDTPGDSVEKLVDEYNNKFGAKLQYYKNSPPLGSPENWNEVMRKAKGEYIKIMHHDDWFTYPDSLACFVKEMEKNPTVSFGFSASTGYNASKKLAKKNFPSHEFLSKLRKNPSILFFGNLIGAPSVIIFRNPSAIQFDRKLKWVVDVDFYIQTLERTKKFVYIERNLVTSVSGVDHSVTSICLTKEVQVFEHVYLYNKLKRNASDDKNYVNFFSSLFTNYGVDHPEQVKKLTGLTELDKNIQKALSLKKQSDLKKTIQKVKQVLKSFIK